MPAWMLLNLALLAAPVDVAVDTRGVATVAVAGQPLLADLAVALIKPAWSGDQGDQRKLDPATVKQAREGDATVTTGVLTGGEFRTQLRMVRRPVPGGTRLEYELTPQQDIPVETILLMGRIPVAGNAGVTRWVMIGDNVTQGVLPAALDAVRYRFAGGSDYDRVGLITPAGAVRIALSGAAPALQDDRKFGSPTFALHAGVGGSRTLKAGQPIRLALTFAAADAAQLDAEAKQAGLGTLSAVPLTSTAKLRAGQVTLSRASVPTYTRVELTADVTGTYGNPFDPDDFAVDADVTRPDGKTVSVPGFFDVPFTLTTTQGRERLKPSGPPHWAIRYTPTAPGAYRVIVRVKDRTGEARCPAVGFTATPSREPGFVRVAPASPHYFATDDGRGWFAVGENVCWANGGSPIAEYDAWFKGLGSAGGNWARLWLANNEKGLEWMPAPTPRPGRGTYLGLGRYSLDNAWRLDRIVDLAAQHGVRLMLCIGTFGELLPEADYFGANLWASNPYNAANGGPCNEPREFFTNPTARQLYQRRLRYLVARWGDSPTVFGWEFWNEYRAPAPWVGEMSAWLKAHDPNQHLVSTTYGDAAVWQLPTVDFTMTHHYGDGGNVTDFGAQLEHTAAAQLPFGKPYFPAEYGIDWRTSDTPYDPHGTGRNLHNGLWQSLMAGSAGTAMIWYWDGYVHPKNLYGVYTPIAKYTAGIDWAHLRFEPLRRIEVKGPADAPETFSDLDLSPGFGWGHQGQNEYTVLPDGTVEGGPPISTLGSPRRADPKELYSEAIWHLNLPRDGSFDFRIGTVSSEAQLQVLVDDQVMLDEKLVAGPAGQGPWKSSKYLEQWKMWQSEYDAPRSVKVPAGKHTVVLRNVAGDWLTVGAYRLPGYRSSRYPDVRPMGLRAERTVLLWLQNRKSTWVTDREGQEPPALPPLTVTVPGVPDGRYRIEWWDTAAGTILRTDTCEAKGGLVVAPPRFRRDVAMVARGQ